MLKRLSWQEDLVLSVKLADDLFTLAQMRVGSCMQFYDVRSSNGNWQGVDLSEVGSLFCAKVAENRLKALFVEKVDVSRVRPDRRTMPLRMIDYELSGDGDPHANLIELDAQQRYSSVGARVVRPRLTIEHDLEIIRTHELVGMLGDPEKLRKRLLRYFETGVNWDDAKAFIFKGISTPGCVALRDTGKNMKSESVPHAAALDVLSTRALLEEGDPALTRRIEPVLSDLIAELRELPAAATPAEKLQPFKRALRRVNRFAARIETPERESILQALYRIGTAVGLDPDSQFAERWRGDW